MAVNINAKAKSPTDFFGSLGDAFSHGAQQIGGALGAAGNFASDAFNHGGIPVQHAAPVYSQAKPFIDVLSQQNPANLFNGGNSAPLAGNNVAQPSDGPSGGGGSGDGGGGGISLLDYMNMAQQMMGGQDLGAIYGQMIANQQAQAAASNKSIGDSYSNLVNTITGQAPTISNYYDQAAKDIAGQTAGAQQGINSAYGGAAATQNSALDALGIGDQARGYLAANGNSAANDQAQSVSNVLQNGTANSNANTLNKASALDLNNNTAIGSGAYGGALQAGVQRQLMNTVQNLEIAQAQARANQLQMALGLANNLNQDEFQREQLKETSNYHNMIGQSRINSSNNNGLTPQEIIQQVVGTYQAAGQTPSPTDYFNAIQKMGSLINQRGAADGTAYVLG